MCDRPLIDSACVPLPIQIVIDDVGWWSGRDGHAAGEPYRTGIDRDHVPADYLAVVELGRRLGMRPVAAMVMGEWDRHNLLRAVPTSTYMGSRWDNRRWIGPWLDEAASIVRNNPRHFEPAVHGIGHEYWDEGRMSRAEFYDDRRQMRPREQVVAHLKAFGNLWAQHDLGPLPTSYVPPAFLHSFGFDDGMAPLLRESGVRWINVALSKTPQAFPPQHELFGIDHGVLTVDGGRVDLLNWNVIGTTPIGEIPSAICGMHWPNLLHEDPDRNLEIVDAWVRLLRPYDDRTDRMLAADTDEFSAQLLHHAYTRVTIAGDQIKLDTNAWRTLQADDWEGPVVIKCQCRREGIRFTSSNARVISQTYRSNGERVCYTLRVNLPRGATNAVITCSKAESSIG